MKKIVLLLSAAFITVTGFAQDEAMKVNRFKDNWFIQGQVGGSYMFSENYEDADFFDLVSPHAAISVGKYFSPIAGARLNVNGWEAKSYITELDKKYKVTYVQANVDGLLNLTNLFLPYKQDRAFNLIAFLGVGYAHGFKNKDYDVRESNSIVPRAGLQADFRLNDALSLNLEANGNFIKDQFNGRVYDTDYDVPVNVLVGVTYRFSKRGFDMAQVADPSIADGLTREVNKLRADVSDKDKEINNLKTLLASKPEPQKIVTEVVKEDTEVLMNAVVVFKLGSAKLEQNQDINVYNAAKYLQENPKVKVTVTGYADKSTGTAAINQRLSEQRAQAVADILTNKYNISSDRISVRASGDKEQPFAKDEWNRVVIFTAR